MVSSQQIISTLNLDLSQVLLPPPSLTPSKTLGEEGRAGRVSFCHSAQRNNTANSHKGFPHARPSSHVCSLN